MRLKIGIVGAGYFGSRHAQIYAGMEGVDLVGVADINASAAEILAAGTGAKPFSRSDGLLGHVDAVSVTVPSEAHADAALPYIRAGVPVLIEKPIANALGDAARIIKASKKSGAPILVGHVERFNPAVSRLMEALDAPPIFVEGRRLGRFSGRALDTDVARDLLIHDIDLLLAIFGEEPRSVIAVGASMASGKIDMASARFLFSKGMSANITASRMAMEDKRRMHIFSERQGYFLLDFRARTLTRLSLAYAGEGERRARAETLESAGPVSPLEAELSHFMDVARGRVAPLVSAEHGRDVLKLALKVVQSVERRWRKRG